MKRRARQFLNHIALPGLILLLFSAIGAFLLAGTHQLTAPAIDRAQRALLQSLLTQVMPTEVFDNDLTQARIDLPADPLLGLKKPGQGYVARQGGKPVGVVLEVIAPDGYAGVIRLIVGIHADGRLGGVRVVAHQETPGLADYIEIKRSPWINQFGGKSLNEPAPAGWAVRKDGGTFDYRTGATVTPRAIVKAVHHALQYFEREREQLLK
jgi:electron transport complex protein RnfG